MGTLIGAGGVTFPDGTIQPSALRKGVGTTITNNTTLTKDSAQVQNIFMSGSGKYITLPNATTMAYAGYASFVLNNIGDVDFQVRDSSGKYVTIVFARKSMIVTLLNTTSANAAWSFGELQFTGGQPYMDISIQGAGIGATCTELAHASLDVQKASSTVVVASFINALNNDFYCVAGLVGSSSITWGTPQLIGASTYSARTRIVPLSATTGIIMGYTTTPTSVYVGYTLSGTTFTLSPTTTSGTSVRGACKIDSTRVFLGYSTGVRVLTYNGDAVGPSLGTGVSDTISAIDCILHDVDKVVYIDRSNQNMRVASIAGTAIALGTILVVPDSAAYAKCVLDAAVPPQGTNYEYVYPEHGTLQTLSSTEIGVISYYNGLLCMQNINISGSTLTESSVSEIDMSGWFHPTLGVPPWVEAVSWLDSTTAVISCSVGSPQSVTGYTSGALVRLNYSSLGLAPAGIALTTSQNDYQISYITPVSTTQAVVGNSLSSNIITMLT